MSLSSEEYERLATGELVQVLAALDQLGEDVDPELASDVLTIEFPDGDRFILNSHRAARQIWLAAATQAWHFDYLSERGLWIASKSGDELWQLLGSLLAKKLSRPVQLRGNT